MSRLSTRTKIAVGVGLVCAVAWLILRPGPPPPPITARFVRYTDPTNLIFELQVSNRTSGSVLVYAPFDERGIVRSDPFMSAGGASLAAHSLTNFSCDLRNSRTLRYIQIRGYYRSSATQRAYHPDFTVVVDAPPPPRAP